MFLRLRSNKRRTAAGLQKWLSFLESWPTARVSEKLRRRFKPLLCASWRNVWRTVRLRPILLASPSTLHESMVQHSSPKGPGSAPVKRLEGQEAVRFPPDFLERGLA